MKRGDVGRMAEWVAACSLDEIPESRGRTQDVGGLRVAIFREGEGVVVISDRCSHAGGSLGAGWVDDGEVVCPLHHWRFRLRDGRCMTSRGQGVHRFAAEIREGVVWIWV